MPKKDQTPKAKVFNIVLPNDLVEKVDKISQDEYRNRSETIREALRNYVDLHSEARKIHGLSEQARESGDPLQALKLNDEAMVAYQEDSDILGFAENLASRVLSLNRLFENTQDKNYLIYGLHTALAALEIAETTGDPTVLTAPLDSVARAYEKLEDYQKASEFYQKAVKNITTTPSPIYNRAAIVADFKIRAATCAYKSGDKPALKGAEQAIKDFAKVDVLSDEQFESQQKQLNFNQEPSYNFHVWVSGAHMRMAEILKKDDPQKAKMHLAEAKKIIDSDSRLTIRKSQVEKLAREFK